MEKSKYAKKLEQEYPELYNIVNPYITTEDRWFNFYQDIFEHHAIDASLEDWDNKILIKILKYLSGKDIIKEGEGDGYRELASNLQIDKDVFADGRNDNNSDDSLSAKNSYKNMTDYLKFAYNEFGDQGYLYFAVFNIKLLRWFLGLPVKSDIKNTRGPLEISDELDDYMEEFTKKHQKKIIYVLIDIFCYYHNKELLSKLIKKYVKKL